jgi:hypothetical protein
MNYEVPPYVIFSILLLRFLSLDQIFSSALCSQTHLIYVISFRARDQVSQPYKTTGEITAVLPVPYTNLINCLSATTEGLPEFSFSSEAQNYLFLRYAE